MFKHMINVKSIFIFSCFSQPWPENLKIESHRKTFDNFFENQLILLSYQHDEQKSLIINTLYNIFMIVRKSRYVKLVSAIKLGESYAKWTNNNKQTMWAANSKLIW